MENPDTLLVGKNFHKLLKAAMKNVKRAEEIKQNVAANRQRLRETVKYNTRYVPVMKSNNRYIPKASVPGGLRRETQWASDLCLVSMGVMKSAIKNRYDMEIIP